MPSEELADETDSLTILVSETHTFRMLTAVKIVLISRLVQW